MRSCTQPVLIQTLKDDNHLVVPVPKPPVQTSLVAQKGGRTHCICTNKATKKHALLQGAYRRLLALQPAVGGTTLGLREAGAACCHHTCVETQRSGGPARPAIFSGLCSDDNYPRKHLMKEHWGASVGKEMCVLVRG